MQYFELAFGGLIIVALMYISLRNRVEREEECRRRLLSLKASMWDYHSPDSPIYDKERVDREYAEELALAASKNSNEN
jgi:hypothetical protein